MKYSVYTRAALLLALGGIVASLNSVAHAEEAKRRRFLGWRQAVCSPLSKLYRLKYRAFRLSDVGKNLNRFIDGLARGITDDKLAELECKPPEQTSAVSGVKPRGTPCLLASDVLYLGKRLGVLIKSLTKALARAPDDRRETLFSTTKAAIEAAIDLQDYISPIHKLRVLEQKDLQRLSALLRRAELVAIETYYYEADPAAARQMRETASALVGVSKPPDRGLRTPEQPRLGADEKLAARERAARYDWALQFARTKGVLGRAEAHAGDPSSPAHGYAEEEIGRLRAVCDRLARGPWGAPEGTWQTEQAMTKVALLYHRAGAARLSVGALRALDETFGRLARGHFAPWQVSGVERHITPDPETRKQLADEVRRAISHDAPPQDAAVMAMTNYLKACRPLSRHGDFLHGRVLEAISSGQWERLNREARTNPPWLHGALIQ